MMMKTFYSLLFIFAYHLATACGPYYHQEYMYYNILSQTNIAAKDLHPFLRDHEDTFYELSESESYNGNLALWRQFAPQLSKDTWYNIVYQNDRKKLTNNNIKSKKVIETYLDFTNKCNEIFQDRGDYSWDYNNILQQESKDYSAYLEEAFSYYKSTANEQIKTRWAYQIIRLFHYARQYDDAIQFFKNQVDTKVTKNELYYYMLDQVAGCYYSLEYYEQAAQMFVEVFANSQDRKRSAFLSYRFCTDRGAEGKTYFKDIKDETTYLTMRSLRTFADPLTDLNALYQLAPNSPNLELLVMREINGLERVLLPKRLGTQNKNMRDGDRSETGIFAERLYHFIKKVAQNSSIENQSFWQLSHSYIAFLNKINGHQALLDKVSDPKFKRQKEILGKIYQSFAWTSITPAVEQFLITELDSVLIRKEYEYDEAPEEEEQADQNWKYLILDQAAHVAFFDQKLAVSFLLYNHLEQANNLQSLELLNALNEFFAKSDKSPLENILAKHAMQESYDPITYISMLKGQYYLQQGEVETAATFLKAANLTMTSISARIFSNNTIECFKCEEDLIMVDSVYLADAFSFIKDGFNLTELSDYLLKLEALTNDPKAWKQELAHYLLGNYYFNISNTGYFRGSLQFWGNCCHHHYFPYYYRKEMSIEQHIASGKLYNLYDISSKQVTYHRLADLAKQHYQKIVHTSSNEELVARTLYMIAKCDLNTYYNKEEARNFYNLEDFTEIKKVYKDSFKKLKEQYSHTQFHQQIIGECSYYRYYTTL